jgi:hypothetical protein
MLFEFFPGGRITAQVGFIKNRFYFFLTPDDITSMFGMRYEVIIPFLVIKVYRSLAFTNGCVVTIVDDTFGHPAEDRFDHV